MSIVWRLLKGFHVKWTYPSFRAYSVQSLPIPTPSPILTTTLLHPTSMILCTLLSNYNISRNHLLATSQNEQNFTTLRISSLLCTWGWNLFHSEFFLLTDCEQSGRILTYQKNWRNSLPWGRQVFTAEIHRPACAKRDILGRKRQFGSPPIRRLAQFPIRHFLLLLLLIHAFHWFQTTIQR